MFELPALRSVPRRREAVQTFRGLDRRARIPAGACREMENLSPRALPCLTVREGRALAESCTAPTDLFAIGGGLVVIDGTELRWGGEVRGTVTAGRHQMAAIGGKLAIFPDKKIFDTETLTLSNMEARITGRGVFTADTLEMPGASVFRAGDGVTITGCIAAEENNKTAVVREVSGDTLTFSENCFAAATEGRVTIAREVPDLEFVCERDNRLWGVHGRTVCCSVLGDPCNWNVFEGLATDGFSVETATDGAFTGCGVYSSHLLFFKEDCVHKVYGVKPSNFQVQVSRIPGVAAGCERSVVNIRDYLYWWSREGLLVYGGGVPDVLSLPLGEGEYRGAAAGADGAKLYLSLLRDGEAELLVFDTEQGAWCREDGTRALAFADCGGLHFLTEHAVYAVSGGAEAVRWSLTLGEFGETEDSGRTLTRLTVIGDFAPGASVSAEVSRDGAPFAPVFAARAQGRRRLRIPVPLRSGRTASVRLAGEGEMTLRAVRLTYLEGSE